ncbi:hypothetical protein [Caulobacter sp. Root655]|uniref:hypothetical protein n=1 Tax=Caulobacter sp. Root655 TaxID=1736578 RepID=UPI0012E36C31|nr:hypothetical protein [Caulobacter sp. Root655]
MAVLSSGFAPAEPYTKPTAHQVKRFDTVGRLVAEAPWCERLGFIVDRVKMDAAVSAAIVEAQRAGLDYLAGDDLLNTAMRANMDRFQTEDVVAYEAAGSSAAALRKAVDGLVAAHASSCAAFVGDEFAGGALTGPAGDVLAIQKQKQIADLIVRREAWSRIRQAALRQGPT